MVIVIKWITYIPNLILWSFLPWSLNKCCSCKVTTMVLKLMPWSLSKSIVRYGAFLPKSGSKCQVLAKMSENVVMWLQDTTNSCKWRPTVEWPKYNHMAMYRVAIQLQNWVVPPGVHHNFCKRSVVSLELSTQYGE